MGNAESGPSAPELTSEGVTQHVNTVLKSDIEQFYGDTAITVSPEVYALRKEVCELRRHFHRNPELSWQEFETSAFIIKYLEQLPNIEIESNIANTTGIVATLQGTFSTNNSNPISAGADFNVHNVSEPKAATDAPKLGPQVPQETEETSEPQESENKQSESTQQTEQTLDEVETRKDGKDDENCGRPCIMLRADMDALPVQEQATSMNSSYISQRDNVSHCCGHDAHLAILLIACKVLSKYQEYLHGTVKFCFQCAEEMGGGANAMIDNGNILQNVDQVYGLHVWSYHPFGKCVVKSGALMAGCLTFDIDIVGVRGDWQQESRNDALLAAAHLVQQIHTGIVGRSVLGTQNGVVTVGCIESGLERSKSSGSDADASQGSEHTADTVDTIGTNDTEAAARKCMWHTAHLQGTIRWFDDNVLGMILNEMKSMCRGIEESMHVNCQFTIENDDIGPPVINEDLECVENVRNAVRQVLPAKDAILKGAKPTMAAEDFSSFLLKKPGCFFFLSCGRDEIKASKENVVAHHTPRFDIDERCLTVGAQIFVTLVLDLLLPTVDSM